MRGFAANIDSSDTGSTIEGLSSSLELMGGLGYDAVELRITCLPFVRDAGVHAPTVAAARRVLDDNRLPLIIHAPLGLGPTSDREWLPAHLATLRVADALGAEGVVVHARNVRGETDMSAATEAFLRLATESEGIGMPIFIEALPDSGQRPESWGNRHDSAAGLAEYLTVRLGLPSGRVGTCLDTGHEGIAAGIEGRLDLDDAGIDRLGMARAVRHIHLHDNFGKPVLRPVDSYAEQLAAGCGDLHMPAGDGVLPLAGMLRSVEDATGGYGGFVTLELEPFWKGQPHPAGGARGRALAAAKSVVPAGWFRKDATR